ncbi:MAG: nucleoside triphosphate pyrophosphohydrolase [Ardenticatenaceae bacterium]|nr:nucleoside triphosphate pyrophosphohydrolase [Ardenticatenaceae bacterium]
MGITIVGLGPGNGRLLTRDAWEVLTNAGVVYLRTSRHPAVADLPDSVRCESFDEIYDAAETFAEVYDTIVARLLQLGQAGEICYAVPGHPFVGEFTVTRLVQEAEALAIAVTVVPGLSFVEPMLTAVRLDALDGVQIFDAIDLTRFHYPPLNPDVPVLLGQVYSRMLASELKMVLTAVYPPEHPVQLIHAAGTPQELVESVPLYSIDHSDAIDHLTSLYVPPLPYKASLATLAETVAVLRSPEGCPWDQEQTPQSMRAGLLEEACEVLEALDQDDPVGLAEELGDMFYHLVMQAQMAAEVEDFRLSDVLAGIEMKLKRRHPHVWGDWEVADTAEVLRNWEILKQHEKPNKPTSLLDNVPLALPALARSQKIQDRVARIGFDWPDMAGVYAKLTEEVGELQAAQSDAEQQAELGDVLFVLVNLARWLHVDAETALREANIRFAQRFQQVEALAAARGLELAALDFAALDALWQEAKENLANGGASVKV